MNFEFVFIRHGETTGNVVHETQCEEKDFLLELTEKWKEQAKETKKILQNDIFDSVFSSDMVRTQQTAEIIFGDTYTIHFDKRLREAYLSTDKDFIVNYEKMPKAERVHMRLVGFTNGETFLSQIERIKSFIDTILTGTYGQKIAIITSAWCFRAIDCILYGMSMEEALLAKKTDNCGVRRVFITKDESSIKVSDV